MDKSWKAHVLSSAERSGRCWRSLIYQKVKERNFTAKFRIWRYQTACTLNKVSSNEFLSLTVCLSMVILGIIWGSKSRPIKWHQNCLILSRQQLFSFSSVVFGRNGCERFIQTFINDCLSCEREYVLSESRGRNALAKHGVGRKWNYQQQHFP